MFRLIPVLLLLSHFAFASSAPVGGHETMRAGAEVGGHQTLGAGIGVNYRYGLHDFLDRQDGYQPETQLDLLSIRATIYPQNKQLYLDELKAFRFIRLPPITAKWEELSWKVEIGGRSLRDPACVRCGAGNLLAGIGATVQPFGNFPVSFWFLFEGEVLVAPGFSGFPIKPAFGPRVGARFQIRPWLNGMLYGFYRYQLASGTSEVMQGGMEWRWAAGVNWALNAKVERLLDGWQALASVYAYF